MKGKRHLRQAQGNIATSPENSRAGGGDIHTNSLGFYGTKPRTSRYKTIPHGRAPGAGARAAPARGGGGRDTYIKFIKRVHMNIPSPSPAVLRRSLDVPLILLQVPLATSCPWPPPRLLTSRSSAPARLVCPPCEFPTRQFDPSVPVVPCATRLLLTPSALVIRMCRHSLARPSAQSARLRILFSTLRNVPCWVTPPCPTELPCTSQPA